MITLIKLDASLIQCPKCNLDKIELLLTCVGIRKKHLVWSLLANEWFFIFIDQWELKSVRSNNFSYTGTGRVICFV